MTTRELRRAVQLSWRNNARCLGRLWWPAMQLRDQTTASTAAEVATAAEQHLRWVMRSGSRRGQLVPGVTLFPADQPGH
ncbi:hypothetical protein KUTG_10073 [Kutzneria sp. 744]|nr:hypothetical protein KUTG_10073 [Kutzneria sp. 744]